MNHIPNQNQVSRISMNLNSIKDKNKKKLSHRNVQKYFSGALSLECLCSKTTDLCSFPIQGSRKKCSGKDHWCFFIPLTPIANPLSLLSKYIRNPTPFNHLR